VLENLHIPARYDGFAYLADTRTLPRLRPHRHVELELNVVERGTITYVIAGRRYRFARRALIWLFPGQEHQLVDGTSDARYFVAVFKPAMLADACRSETTQPLRATFPPSASADRRHVLHADLDVERYDIVRLSLELTMEGGPDPDVLSREAGFGVSSNFRYKHDDPESLNAGLRNLLMLCWRMQAGRSTRRQSVALHAAVRRAMTLLSDETSEADQQSLESLAAACGVSAAHLSRTFARQVGMPLSRYRNALRMRRFWDHHQSAVTPSMTDAAYAAGFGSYAQFYKVFVSTYGKGPREFETQALAGDGTTISP
jgi:methylphosphotriester-DNA--protein-cysteine methyltransferase